MNKIIEINPLTPDNVKKRFIDYTKLLYQNMTEVKEEIKDDVNIRLLRKKYEEVKEDVDNKEWINSLFVGNYFDTLDFLFAFAHPLSQVYNQLIYTYLVDMFQEKILKLPIEQQRLMTETLSSFDMNPYSYKMYIDFLFNSKIVDEIDSQFKSYWDKHHFCIDVVDTVSVLGIQTTSSINHEALSMLHDHKAEDKSFDNVGLLFDPPIFTVSSIYRKLFKTMTEVNEFFLIFHDEEFEDLALILKLGEQDIGIQQEFFELVREVDLKNDKKITKIKEIIAEAKTLVPYDNNFEGYKK